jgi:hypothetical protein
LSCSNIINESFSFLVAAVDFSSCLIFQRRRNSVLVVELFGLVVVTEGGTISLQSEFDLRGFEFGIKTAISLEIKLTTPTS